MIVSEGVSLSETAADVSRTVDPDAIQLVDGRMDLAAIDALAAPPDRWSGQPTGSTPRTATGSCPR